MALSDEHGVFCVQMWPVAIGLSLVRTHFCAPPVRRPQRPPLPKRPRSHRKPRRRRSSVVWHLCGYTLAALGGALAHHLTTGLF